MKHLKYYIKVQGFYLSSYSLNNDCELSAMSVTSHLGNACVIWDGKGELSTLGKVKILQVEKALKNAGFSVVVREHVEIHDNEVNIIDTSKL